MSGSPFVLPMDTNLVETVSPGVNYRFIYSPTGPWAIHMLVVDLASCNAVIAVKGLEGAAGRKKVSTTLAELSATQTVLGGVNADFFSLTTGAPIGALVSGGTVITGPYSQPVLAFDSVGLAHATVLRANGSLMIGGQRREIHNWNRGDTAGLALLDANWGRTTDTATSTIKVTMRGAHPSRVTSIDTTNAGTSIPADGAVLVAGRATDRAVRSALATLRVGDTLRVMMGLAPSYPRDAVGGRPMLTRDSLVVGEVDTEGQVSFRLRNPRTAAGISRGGRRLILVVVDGRQKGYSDGMTLRELANLMLMLGARDAINLDGGGSSTLVFRDRPRPAPLRIANSTSDTLPNGQHVERAVGDALAIVRTCP